MKLFRLRFIVLGLLLCVFHVWCRTCGTSFTSTADSAYLSQVVVEGRVVKVWDPVPSGRYNVTINIRKIRKGDDLLINGKRTKLLTIGEFGDEDKLNCVTKITKSKQKWYFFLKSATNSQVPSDYLTLSAFPVAVSKKTGRFIRKIVCRGCAKKPVLKKIRAKDVREGRRIKLGCRVVKARPPPKFRWEKDGVEISSSKRIKIKSSRRGSRLTIKKALKTDGGEYRCIATNVVGTAEQVATFKVKPRPSKNGNKRPGKKVTTTQRPQRYIPCLPEDKDYCLNGGQCRLIVDLNNAKSCVCLESYIGKRCQYFSGPIEKKIVPAGTQKLERDRTIIITGVVIGILVLICICIASYFLAKRRREQYFKRQEKRRLEKSMSLGNSTNTFSYPKSPYGLDNSVNYQGFVKTYTRQNTVNTDTQTDEINIPPLNSNPRVNMYLNPIENQPMRSSSVGSTSGQRNSRSRLSGVSLGGGDRPSNQPHSPDTGHNALHKETDQGKEKSRKKSSTSEDLPSKRRSRGSTPGGDPRKRGEVPRITISDSDSGGEEDHEEETVRLRISESSPRSARRSKQRASIENSPRYRSREPQYRSDSERSPRHYSQTLTSESPSTSADELRALHTQCNGQSSPRRCSDSLSWNERGSPEQQLRGEDNSIEDPRYKKDLYNQFPKGFNFNGPSTSYNTVCDDEPSIPI